MNLWHDVPRGEDAPEKINVIIEIPKGSHNKYEIDKETGLIKLDRANYGPTPYFFDYGFVPQTLWEDDDPLDVVLLTTYPLHPGVLVEVRPVAVMEMIDDGDSDYKVIGVPAEDRRFESVQDLPDVNEHFKRELQHFFETVKALKGKEVPVTIHGFKGAKDAKEAVTKSIELYNEKFAK